MNETLRLQIMAAILRVVGYGLIGVPAVIELGAFPGVTLAGGAALVVEGVLTEREATR